MSIIFLSMSRPELVKIAMVTSAQKVSNEFARQKNRIGEFKARNLNFGTLRRSLPFQHRVKAWMAGCLPASGTHHTFTTEKAQHLNVSMQHCKVEVIFHRPSLMRDPLRAEFPCGTPRATSHPEPPTCNRSTANDRHPRAYMPVW
jgi:hypothetical protein